MTDKIYNIISIFTLSGLSAQEADFTGRFTLPVLLFLIVLYGDFDFYRNLFSHRNSGARRTEILTYAAMVAAAAALYFLFPDVRPFAAYAFMLMGACSHSLSGGVGLYNFIMSLKLTGKAFVLKAHPNATYSMKLDGQTLKETEAANASSDMIMFIVAHLAASLIVSFGAASYTDAILISLAAIANNGYVLLLMGCMPDASAYPVPIKIFIIILMLAGRVNQIRKATSRGKAS